MEGGRPNSPPTETRSTTPKPTPVSMANNKQRPAVEHKPDATIPPIATSSQQPPVTSQVPFHTPLGMYGTPAQGQPAVYSMTQMTNCLPVVWNRPFQHQQEVQGYNTTAVFPMSHQLPHQAAYGRVEVASVPMNNEGYYAQMPQMPRYDAACAVPPIQVQPNIPSGYNMAYFPNQSTVNYAYHPPYYAPINQYPVRPPNMTANMVPSQDKARSQGNQMSPTAGQDSSSIMSQVNREGAFCPRIRRMVGHAANKIISSIAAAPSRRSGARGSPRKPRQSGMIRLVVITYTVLRIVSGHAIWIGNLPSHADLMKLVQHVCKESVGLESLFLISKSNCAFANFEDELSCWAAQKKIHDSRFQSVRLVGRLRKDTAEGATALTAPAGVDAGGSTSCSTSPDETLDVVDSSKTKHTSPAMHEAAHPKISGSEVGGQGDKFFILKSLTLEDLEVSVKSGIWATQAHNEQALNDAFKVSLALQDDEGKLMLMKILTWRGQKSEKVYLIFSANKSGEYFGYARMASEINGDAGAVAFAPKAHPTSISDLPISTPTEAFGYAPKGRIVKDAARGTIFWEVWRGDDETPFDDESEVLGDNGDGMEGHPTTLGRSFKLEWLSINRLPFHRTRGLRNPWNSNREVKIARDGTELEPSVGRRLIGLFNQEQCPGQAPLDDFDLIKHSLAVAPPREV
ncbi:hypothetical protein DCS_07437 [Drechmeria coniospora]|uniref:YTH domain-containing protein n=1 Tax=Drechmeria coniospora TaxID=98403 RepID=A0A151GEF2_DRECN|nr:hypothetical protein DCS_07437 [Drechmeria coniospora]KYK55474.1 hypothetical protein DCS_07437 [Drechmeria coniospora]